VLDQLGPAQVHAAEDVALAGLALVGGEHVAVRGVLDVGEVHRGVDHARQAAAQVVADRARRGLAGLLAVDRDAEQVGGVDDHDLDPVPLAGGERGQLALVLGVGVGEPEPVTRVLGQLARRLPVGGRPDRGDRRGQHHALEALRGGRLDRDDRGVGVQAPDQLGRVGADEADGVEEHVGALQRPPHRLVVEHVGLRAPHLDPLQVLEPLGVAVRHADLVPALGEELGHVPAQEAGRAGHHRLHER
jgi:hypothetical protein